jgi:O-succinylbenzoic acid--CoA ligase
MRDWLSARTAVTPDSTALVHAASGETWTFAELDADVTDLAGRLAALGVTEGDHLGAVMGASTAYVRLVHAAMRLGATLVPLDHRSTAGELGGMVETADVTTLVCDADTESVAVEAAGDVPVVSVDLPADPDVRALSTADPASVDPAEWALDDTLFLLFTSGTTGDPKAVILQVRNVLASAVASTFRLGFHRDDRWLVTLSLHHTGGIAPVIRMPLYGMTVVLCDEFEAGTTADRVETYDVTAVSLVPTMLRRMLDSRGTLADSLRVVLLGGAPARSELVERCRNYSVPVFPTYGMTEAASQIATATPDEAFAAPETAARCSGSRSPSSTTTATPCLRAKPASSPSRGRW